MSQILTLYTTPVVYLYLDRLRLSAQGAAPAARRRSRPNEDDGLACRAGAGAGPRPAGRLQGRPELRAAAGPHARRVQGAGRLEARRAAGHDRPRRLVVGLPRPGAGPAGAAGRDLEPDPEAGRGGVPRGAAVVREARAGLFPVLSTTAGAQRQRRAAPSSSGSLSANGDLQRRAAAARRRLQPLQPPGRRRAGTSTSGAGSGAAWRATSRTAQASAADLASARLSAQGELAADYFQLRALDAQQRLLDEHRRRSTARALQIAQNQYNAGIAARSDVVHGPDPARDHAGAGGRPRRRAGAARARDRGADRQRRPPSSRSPSGPLAARVPVAPASLPSALLERRPDIAAAERRMQQQNALIGVAVAAYYPDISSRPRCRLRRAARDLAVPDVGPRSGRWRRRPRQTVFEGGLRGAQVEAARAGLRPERGGLPPDGARRLPGGRGPALRAPHPAGGGARPRTPRCARHARRSS